MQEKQKKSIHPAKAYLSKYCGLKSRVDDLEEELEYIGELATKATSRITAERVSGTSMKDGMANAVLRGLDAKEEIERIVSHLKEQLAVRLILIEEMEDENEKLLLTELYINGREWRDVLQRMERKLHYGRTKVFEIHGLALNHFWENYQKHKNAD